MPGKVLRLTLQDHDREGKRLVGAALVALQETGLVAEVSTSPQTSLPPPSPSLPLPPSPPFLLPPPGRVRAERS